MKPTSSTTSRLNKVLASLGSLTRSCKDVRHCSRCNLPLTDAASWERGIGPVCAKKDTHLYAKTIPANFAFATLHTMNVESSMLPETLRPVWSALTSVLLEKVERASRGTADTQFLITGEDCRIVAKVIDHMLSYPIEPTPKRDLIEVVKHLGFVGLAGVLSGKGSTGDADLKFDPTNGMLTLRGSKNRAGWVAMRKIPTVALPRLRTDRTYVAPAAVANEFIAVVMEFWPCFDGEVDAIRSAASAWAVKNPPPAVTRSVPSRGITTPSNKPSASLMYRSATDEIVVSFKWMANVTPGVVAALKNDIPNKKRSYHPPSRCWVVRAEFRDALKAILAPHYDVREMEGASPAVPSIGAPGTAGHKFYSPASPRPRFLGR